MASSRKTGPAKRSSDDNHDPGVGSSRPLGPRHRQPSTDTVVHHPQTRKENLRPTTASTNPRTNTNEVLGLRTVRVYTGLNNVLGFTDRPTSASDSYPALTRQPNWKTPESIRQVIDHQNKRFGEPKPKESSFAQQSLTRNRVFDPEDGPTDCQHPEDPRVYSTHLNPIRKDDPGFAHCGQPLPEPTTPKKASPGDKLISKVSPSKARVTQEGKLRLTFCPPGGVDQAVECLKSFSNLNLNKGKQAEYPDEMLAARHLSNFLTDNVEEGVATSYM
ncbi:MAG: hypothetical protein L6R39_007804 [Caloplaca ligustica]|nr:MAG: hypothetical protein L6R39_007804 [Caloplaca ligustica]